MTTKMPVTPHDTSAFIGCPQCDAIYTLGEPQLGQTAHCLRCGTRLISPRKKAGVLIIALSLTIAIMIIAASVFPFLTISAAGHTNSVSILQAAFVFTDGILVVLSLATAALVILIPLMRVLLSLYVLVPLVANRPPAPGATNAFRLSESLRPWSMAEIFAIGCAVALVKITELAHVEFGVAFWMFTGLVFLIVLQDRLICRWSVWNALDKTRT